MTGRLIVGYVTLGDRSGPVQGRGKEGRSLLEAEKGSFTSA